MLDHDTLLRGEATLPALLRMQARERGDQVALREKEYGIWRGRTWADYWRDARRVALGLWKLGLQKGDRLIIAAEDGTQGVYAERGAQMSGVQGVGNGLWVTSVTDPDGYRLDFESLTDMPEESEYKEEV